MIKTYRVSRCYALRMTWQVQASSMAIATAMLDNEDLTPFDEGEEEWLGPVSANANSQLVDRCELLPNPT